jgi:hypothetical protein
MPKSLKQLAYAHYKSLKLPKPGMICAARLKADGRVFYGRAGKAPDKDSLAGGLGKHLRNPPAQAGQGWSSDNCAEVHAAHKILKSLNVQFAQTGGVEFCSIDSHGEERLPCLNCKQWVYKL